MNLQTELKQDLHKMIDQITDVNVLQALHVILERENQTEQVPHHLLQSIERGLEQIKKGQTVPHEDVKKRYDKWLK
jgi:predicted transcriptional regulator